MAREEKVYDKIEEAEKLIVTLCEKYPDVLWRVRPARIAVLGITNKERSKKSKSYFKVNCVKGAQKALNILYHVPVSNIIEFYFSDWSSFTQSMKEWMVMKALLTIGEEDGKIIKPDCTDFRILLDIVGVDWEKNEVLPSLTEEDVKFKLELRPAIEEEEATEGTDDDEE